MKKRSIIRCVLIGIPVLIVCLFALASIVVNTSAFRNFLRSEISKQALSHIGARVEVGSIATHWWRLTFDLNNIVVYGNSGPAAPPLLTASHLRVAPKFLPILHRRVELHELVVDQPVVRLAIDARGRGNLPVAPHPSASGNGPNEFFDLEISNLVINSGQIFYNNAETPLDAQLHNLRFNAAYGLLTGEYKGSLSYDNGRVVSRRFAPIENALQMQFAASRAGISLTPVQIATRASHITLNVKLTNYEHPSIEATYQGTLSTQEIADVLRSQSMPMGIVTLSGKLTYQSTDDRPFIAAVSMHGQLHSDRLTIPTGERPIDATSLSTAYSLNDATLQVQSLVADILGGRARGNFQMQHLDAAISPSQLGASIQGVSLETASRTLAPQNVQRIPFAGTTNLNVNASWAGPIKDAIAHARLAIQGPRQANPAKMIPVDGLLQVDYNGPQDTIAFGQSHLQTANTKLSIAGTLSAKRNGNSSLSILATTSDLSEAGSLASMIQNAMEPDAAHAQIPPLGGAASLIISATGPAREPSIQGRLNAQNLAVDGSHWRSLALNVSGNSSGIRISNGVLAGDGKAEISFNGHTGLRDWSLTDSSPLQIQVSMANMPVDTAEAIAQLHYPLTGSLSANVTVSGTKSAPNGKATLTLSRASAWNQEIDNLAVDAQSQQGAIHATVNLKIPAGAVSANASYTLATQQYNVQLQGNGIKLDQIAALQAKAAIQGTADLSASGSGTIHNPQLNVKFAVPRLQAAGQTISNIAAEVDVANEHAALQFQSVADQGSVQAKADIALTGDRQTTATLDVRALPISVIAADFLPSQAPKIGGQTEIHLDISGPLKAPAQMQGHLQIPALNVTYGKAQLALAKPLSADYRGGTLTVAPASIQGTGTNLTFGGTIPIKSAASYSLMADGTVDLGVLREFASGVKSSGQLELHLHSSGQLSKPTMQGQFLIKDAVFTTQSLPVAVEGLNAQINLSGNRADIARFSGSVGGGTVAARGFAVLGRNSAFNVSFDAQSVRILYPEGLRSMLTAQLNLAGSTESSSLTGRVLVNNISLTQQFDLSTFADSFTGESVSGSPSAFENNMKLRIAVQSSQDINLSNSQLSLAGSANLSVVGSLAQPVILGRVALTSGDVFFLSKRFQIQSGTIQFANPVRTEPVVRMYITTTVEQYNVTLDLNGPIDRLRTNYTSDPALAPADIIHLLAFGNTTAEAASQPSQSAAMGAESVLAQGAGSQVAGRLQNITGLSQISIDPLATNSSGDPGAQIAIQERITGSVLFTFSSNVTTTQGQIVELQYDVNKRWSVTVLRDQNGGYGLDVRLHKVF